MSSAPYQLTDNDILYYLHIPKTAGTSLAAMIKENFEPDQFHLPIHANVFLKTPPETVAKYKFVEGHFYYNLAPFVTKHPVYITVLRNPVELTISYYAQMRRSRPHYGHKLAISQSLLEFVKNPNTRFLWSNLQTRHVATDLNLPEMASKISPEALEDMELERQMDQVAPNGFDDPALLTRAQERLSKFAFVGLVERFDESVETLWYLFGWSSSYTPKVINVAPNRPRDEEISQEVLDVIREHTQLDAALYETGKDLFNARYEQMLKDHPEKIRRDTSKKDDPIEVMQRELDFQKRLIDSLQKEKMFFENQVSELLGVVGRYENSFGWQFVLRFNAARKKLIPEGSKREAIYQKLRDRLN